MSNKQEKSRKELLSNLVSICTLMTLLLIMAQVYFARHAIVQSSKWENAKLTIENIEHFSEKLKETALYDQVEAKFLSDNLWPDFTKSENYELSDTLRKVYNSLFDDRLKRKDDIDNTLRILDAFAYPIIIGYASEMGSFQSAASGDFYIFCNYIMPFTYNYHLSGINARLLYRLWRVRFEQSWVRRIDIGDEDLLKNYTNDIKNMLCFEGTEVTPDALKQYEKKLEKELEKIQKEINEFRKIRLK